MSRSFVRRRAANRSLLPRPSAVARVALMTGSCNSDRAAPGTRPPGPRPRRRLARRRARAGPPAATVVRRRQGRPAAVQRRRPRGHRARSRTRASTSSPTSSCTTSRPPWAAPPPSSARTGARYLTTHAAGGVVMVRAAVEGFEHGAATAGHARAHHARRDRADQRPDSGPDVLAQRVAVAVAAGAPGLVCSAAGRRAGPLGLRGRDRPSARGSARPGRRPTTRRGWPARGEAAAAGADILVLGRGVTHAVAPEATAAAVADEVAAALARLAPRSTHPSGRRCRGRWDEPR